MNKRIPTHRNVGKALFEFNRVLATRFEHHLACPLPDSAPGTKAFHNNLVPPNGSIAAVPWPVKSRGFHSKKDDIYAIKPLVVS